MAQLCKIILLRPFYNFAIVNSKTKINVQTMFMKNFIKILMVIVASVFVSSCANTDDHIPFHRMTEEQLVAYNQTVDLEDNVYCFEDVRTGSFIRKVRCMTLFDIVTAVNDNSHTLGVLNYGGTPPFGPRRD